MFTGLVETLGTIRRVEPERVGKRLTVEVPAFAQELADGDSVALNGACLTVIEHDVSSFHCEAGPETLLRTNLGELAVGDQVNLERSLRLSDRLGGHLVQGHVDGVGRIAERRREGDWELVWFSCRPALSAQMVSKGSVALDGVSLTLVEVQSEGFSVALIPHTLSHTTLGFKAVGAAVNLETDLIGKYVWRYLQQLRSPAPSDR